MYAMYVVSKAKLCQSFEPSSFLCQCTIQGHRKGSFSRGARPLNDNFEMSFWYLQFPPKNKQKQVNLRFHSNKVSNSGHLNNKTDKQSTVSARKLSFNITNCMLILQKRFIRNLMVTSLCVVCQLSQAKLQWPILLILYQFQTQDL